MLAHMWLNIAGANGTEVARENRDNLERVMTRAEISRATELARECTWTTLCTSTSISRRDRSAAR